MQIKIYLVYILAYSYLKEMATAIKNNQNLKDLSNLVLYHPWTLGIDADRVQSDQAITETLLTLNKFQLLTIITGHDIESLLGFKKLGNKIKVIKEDKWYDKQSW